MMKPKGKLVLMTSSEFAAKLIDDNEGNIRIASNWFFTQMRNGYYLNETDWLQSVAVHLFAAIAAEQVR